MPSRQLHRIPRAAVAVLLAAGLVFPAASCGSPQASAAGDTAEAPAPAAPHLALAAPTGPAPVGRADAVLADDARADPWVPGERRRVAVTVWYPAATAGGPAAPYTGPLLAAELDRTATPAWGLPRGSIDWAGVDTHAVAGAVVAPGRHPAVLYSPGSFESRLQGSGLAVELAGHGYVVIALDHTYETTVEVPGALLPQRVGPTTAGDQASTLEAMERARVADVRTVLDRLPELPAGASVDPARIGLVGHSAGGDTAVRALADDPRPAAAVDLDGFLALDSTGTRPLDVARSGVDRPVLLMGSDSAVDRLPAPGEEPVWVPRTHRQNPAWAALWNASTGPRLDVSVAGARHHVFTDSAALLPPLVPAGLPAEVLTKQIGDLPDPARAAASIRALVRAFLDRHLRGLPAPLLDGPTPDDPDLRFVG